EIERSGLSADVHLMGDVPPEEMPALYRLSDVVLIPSVPDEGVVEATSIAALEGMASGCVVIASDLGGLREIVSHGETGLLVSPGDPDAIARAILAVLEDAPLAARIGSAGRRRAVAHHATGAAAARFEEVYAEAAARIRAD